MAPKVVLIESPYSAPSQELIQRNVEYAYACATDSYATRGEAPIVPHLLLTQLPRGQFVGDEKPVLRGREFALECCRELRKKADLVAFYLDHGWSSGMERAREEALKDGIACEERYLYKDA